MLSKWVFLSIYFTVMLRTWTYPWTIAKKMHYCYSYNEISMHPFSNNFFLIKLDVAGYMEISMDPFSNKFLN